MTSHELRDPEALEPALADAAAGRAEALFIIPSRLTVALREKIATAARGKRWPTVAAWREFAESGCLVSYGPTRGPQARKIASYIHRVLAGAKPGDIPIQRPDTFELVVNQKTAAAIGVEIAPALLDRADKVIE